MASGCYREVVAQRMPVSTWRSSRCIAAPTFTVTGFTIGGPEPSITGTTVYVPGGSARWYRPSASVCAACTAPSDAVARTVPVHTPGGHGEPWISTGHVGPAVTVPSIPPLGGEAAPGAHDTRRLATIATRRVRIGLGRDAEREGSRSARIGGRPQHADVRQVAVLLRVVEPVADDELVGD